MYISIEKGRKQSNVHINGNVESKVMYISMENVQSKVMYISMDCRKQNNVHINWKMQKAK